MTVTDWRPDYVAAVALGIPEGEAWDIGWRSRPTAIIARVAVWLIRRLNRAVIVERAPYPHSVSCGYRRELLRRLRDSFADEWWRGYADPKARRAAKELVAFLVYNDRVTKEEFERYSEGIPASSAIAEIMSSIFPDGFEEPSDAHPEE